MREWAKDSALNLAAFRITVGGLLLWLPDFHRAVGYAALPSSVRTPPVGLEWAETLLVPGLVEPLYWIAIASVVLGTVGFFTRTSWIVASVSLLVVLAVPQTIGSTFHYHHLLWFAALFAASPSGDALSIDAWLAKRRGTALDRGRSVVYGAPLRFAWVLIGIVFFFPGLWKVITGGAAWVFSDNLRNQMYAKWTQHDGFTPLFRVDRHPWLLNLGAGLVVLLELSFGVLVVFRRTRLLAVGAAILFHLATAYLMNLHFEALWFCYIAFVDVAELTKRATEGDDDRSPRPSLVVGAALVAGSFGFGAAGVSDGWPFACYPKFDRVLSTTTLPALEVVLVREDGSTEVVPVEHMSATGRTPRWWALTWSLLGAHERARADCARFEAFWDQVSVRGPLARADYESVRFERVTISTVPEQRDDPPSARRLVCEIRARPSP